jgi:hypothetical protein
VTDVPDDLSGLDPTTGAVLLSSHEIATTVACTTPECDNDAEGLGDLCSSCFTNHHRRRSPSRSPKRDPSLRVRPLEEYDAAGASIMGAVSEEEERALQRHVANLRRWGEAAGVAVPLSDPRDVRRYAARLLEEHGLPWPEAPGNVPNIDHDDRIVRSTWDSLWRLLDKWHLRNGVEEPWKTYTNTPEGKTFKADLSKGYLKADAGMARDPLELDSLFELLIALGQPGPDQVASAALVAATTHPGVEVDGVSVANGAKVPLGYWGEVGYRNLHDAGDGTMFVTGLKIQQSERIVRLPAPVAQLVQRLRDLRWGVDTDDGRVLAESRWNGPMWVNAKGDPFGKNGVGVSVRRALEKVSGTDPSAWMHRGQILMPKVGEGDVVLDRLLRPDPRQLRDAAWLSNAWWVVARGMEVLARHPADWVPSAAGPLWFLPRKTDATGRRTPYVAPHLRWPDLDPTVLLKRLDTDLRARWVEQGHHPNDYDKNAWMFPTDLDDLTAKPARSSDTLAHFNRRLAMYKQRYPFLPTDLNLGTHSLRHGFVTTGRTLGVPDAALMHAGGWIDATVFHGYLATIAPGSAASAGSRLRAAFDPQAAADAGLTGRLIAVTSSLPATCTCSVCQSTEYPVSDIEAVIR